MLQALGAVAEFERAIMLERQCEGIAKAKAEEGYTGRAKTAMAKAGEVETMLTAGMTPTELARKLGIGRSSVYRAIRPAALYRNQTCPAERRPGWQIVLSFQGARARFQGARLEQPET